VLGATAEALAWLSLSLTAVSTTWQPDNRIKRPPTG
jgi:hypothetical protein